MFRTATLLDSAALDDLRVFVGRAREIEDGSVRLISAGGILAVYVAVLYPVGLRDETPTVLGLRTFALEDTEDFDVVVPIRSLEQRLESAKLAVSGARAEPDLPADPDAPEGPSVPGDPVAPEKPDLPGESDLPGDPDAQDDPDVGAGPVVPEDSSVPEESVVHQQQGRPVTVNLPMEVNTVTWTAISPPRGGWVEQQSTEAAVLEPVARSGIEEIATAVPEAVGSQIVRKARSEVWGRPIEGLEHVPAGAAFAAFSLGFLGEDAVSIHETGPWTRLTTRRGHVLIKRRAWTLSR